MTVELRPMTEPEYAEFDARARQDYVHQLVEYGSVETAAAEAKARRDFGLTLPDGLATPGQWLYTIVADGVPVGHLWFAERVIDGRTVAYLYDITVDEQHRRRGHGRGAMEAFEREAARRGLRELELNVFGGNAGARELYRSLGWRETSLHMRKSLPSVGVGQSDA